jgi:hypothetical protein
MKKFILLAFFGLAATQAFAYAPVNIVYPISGQAYVNYFTSSFSATCPGGPHAISWRFEGLSAPGTFHIGKSTFYDQTSVQFTHKLPSGHYVLYVESPTCGGDKVDFWVR